MSDTPYEPWSSQPRFGKNMEELLHIRKTKDGKLPVLPPDIVDRAMASAAIGACPSLGSWRLTSFPQTYGLPKEEEQEEKNLNGLTLEDISFGRDLEELYYYQEGENDESPWILIGKLKIVDKTYFFHLDASCDYTGFDCQGGGVVTIESTFEDLASLFKSKF